MMKKALVVLVILISFSSFISTKLRADDESYLSWSDQEALRIGKSMIAKGRVGAFWDGRVTHTERSYNYKLRATWIIPEVIRASARFQQLKDRLTIAETEALVSEAENVGDTVIMVEIDPREGSGVIPLDWRSFFQPKRIKEGQAGAILGKNCSECRMLKALRGVSTRDYAYDLFWIVFPLTDENGDPVLSESVSEAELVVRIYGKEGHVSWQIPSSIRSRSKDLALTRKSSKVKER